MWNAEFGVRKARTDPKRQCPDDQDAGAFPLDLT